MMDCGKTFLINVETLQNGKKNIHNGHLNSIYHRKTGNINQLEFS